MKKMDFASFKAILIFSLILCFHQNSARGAPVNRIQNFALSKLWLRALHYQPTNTGYRSDIVNPDFFLSQNGATSPLAELEAFIAAFNSGEKIHDRSIHCAFPYRTYLLSRAGLIDFKSPKCEAFEFYRYELGDEKISMVFVGQYADDPASLLGHLFLKFAHKDRKIADDPVEYLQKTFNYAAAIPEDTNIVKYIAYGIFGGFDGRYSQNEFNDLVEKYNNMESRDLFIYPLQLSDEERFNLIAHSWELINFGGHDYFFFDRNCAYQLLALIEVATNQDLTGSMPFYSTPIDVLKTLSAASLISEYSYKPSLFQQLEDNLSALSEGDLAKFHSIKKGVKPVDALDSALLVETLIAYAVFNKHEAKGKWSHEDQSRYEFYLLQRSKLGTAAPKIKTTQKTSPHLSHPDSRLALGYLNIADQEGSQLVYRPVFHDLLSPASGYEPYSHIELFGTQLAHFQSEILLNTLTITKVSKYSPSFSWDDYAWNFDFSVKHTFTCKLCFRPEVNLDIGWSRFLGDNAAFVALGSAQAGQIFNASQRPWGLGVRTGIIWQIAASHRTYLLGRTLSNLKNHDYRELEFAWQSDLDKRWDLRLQFRRFTQSESTLNSATTQIGYSF